LLAISMVLSLPALADRSGPADPGGTFTDDDDSVHQGGIEGIKAAAITMGCNPPANYLFCGRDHVTRGQMAAFLTRALDLAPATDDYFTDDDGTIFETAINRLREAEITTGCNPPDHDRFCPTSTVTRGQMAAFFARAFKYPETDANPFTDDEGHIFENAIEKLAAANITVGCNPPASDHFCPDSPVTREQMATFITRAVPGVNSIKPPSPTRVPVVSVTDGETIRVLLNGVDESLRFIGIDAPESGDICFEEATQAMVSLVEGETVRIDLDETERDPSGRLLRHVFLTDGTLVSAELVRLGWAAAASSPPDLAFSGELSRRQDEAQAADRGIWGDNCS
jgi:endonuclease YncB( thermonuclease family)